jgi:hypothetical protein
LRANKIGASFREVLQENLNLHHRENLQSQRKLAMRANRQTNEQTKEQKKNATK